MENKRHVVYENRPISNLPKNKKNHNLDFLILGHPRSGTGYMYKLFNSLGFDIKHEMIGKDGMSCWTFAADKANHLFGADGSIINISRQDIIFKHLIHNVRNPFDVINSVYFTEARTHSQVFRLYHATPSITTNLEVKNKSNSDVLNETILSVIRWNRMIEKLNPNLTVKVEDCDNEVIEYLKNNSYKVNDYIKIDKKYNTRKGSINKLKVEDYNKVPESTLEELNKFCEDYNYKNILK